MAGLLEFHGLYSILSNWVEKEFGEKVLYDYWEHIGETCCDDFVELAKTKGFEGIKVYIEESMKPEGYEIEIREGSQQLTMEILKCPAFDFSDSTDNPYFKLKEGFCDFDRVVYGKLAERAGLAFKVERYDTKGRCVWEYRKEG